MKTGLHRRDLSRGANCRRITIALVRHRAMTSSRSCRLDPGAHAVRIERPVGGWPQAAMTASRPDACRHDRRVDADPVRMLAIHGDNSGRRSGCRYEDIVASWLPSLALIPTMAGPGWARVRSMPWYRRSISSTNLSTLGGRSNGGNSTWPVRPRSRRMQGFKSRIGAKVVVSALPDLQQPANVPTSSDALAPS